MVSDGKERRMLLDALTAKNAEVERLCADLAAERALADSLAETLAAVELVHGLAPMLKQHLDAWLEARRER